MLISGIQQFTLIDYPGKTACIIFTPGCNFRCGYCHNPEFVLPERITQLKKSFIPEKAFWNFLKSRLGSRVLSSCRSDGEWKIVPLLDGVVISGGEPTMQGDLIPFMEKIKAQGFLVKLDTNGNRPEIITKALARGLVDYIAMDVKTSLETYRALVGPMVSPEKIKMSMELIQGSGVAYEFRSTLIKEVHSPAILQSMVELVRGARRVFLQSFRAGTTLAPDFAGYHAFSPEEMMHIAKQFQQSVAEVAIRS